MSKLAVKKKDTNKDLKLACQHKDIVHNDLMNFGLEE